MSKNAPIEELVLDERMQARAALDQSAVDDYAASYRAKVDLPPVDVFVVDGVKYVTDGWHRIAGARTAGERFMRHVIVGTGSIDDAIWRALASNKTHGVRRSSADKRRAIRLALDSAIGVEQSSRALAEYLGVSDKLVSEVRASWEAERVQVRNSAPAEDDASETEVRNSAPDRRVGRDGKSYPVRAPKERVVLDEPTEDIDEGVAQALLEDIRSLVPWPAPEDDVPPLPHERESAAPADMPTYGPALDVAAKGVRAVRHALRNAGLPTWLAQRFETALKAVESDLTLSMPETCPRCSGARCRHCREAGWVSGDQAQQLRASASRGGE